MTRVDVSQVERSRRSVRAPGFARFSPRLAAFIAVSFLWISLGMGFAHAETTRHVSIKGRDVGDCTTDPCRTIGYAISQSSPRDVIEIARGTYDDHVTVDR